MLAALGSGYHGPPALTFPGAFTSWHVDPWTLAAVVVAAGLYLAGVRRVRRGGGSWQASSTVWFCVFGLGFAIIATMSSVGVYTPVLFYMRSVQTILLLLVVPLFVAMGRPLSLIIATVPGVGPRLDAAIKSKIVRLATFPAITTFVLVITPFLIYFTPWYAAGFRSVLVAQVTHLALLTPGFVFFWTLLRVDPVPKAYPYVVALWITAAEVLGDAILGLAVIADTSLLAGSYYHALARPWGPSLATTQVLGGGVLWIFGDIVGLPFLAAQLIQMIREDEADAKVIDAELDAQEAAAMAIAGGSGAATTPAAGDASPVPAGEAALPVTQRPWWETDQRFADRFRAVDEPGNAAHEPGGQLVAAPDQEGPAG
jgi:cytochrome c oxidase assembly factor CtaG